MRLKWILPVALFCALACTGGSGGSDGDSGSDTGDTGSPDAELMELTDPCGGAGTPYKVLFTDADHGYIGCGNGIGLWYTEDGGASFTRAHDSADLYVYDIALDASGRLLVCGHDYESSADDAMLYRRDGSEWTTLLRYGNNSDDSGAVYMSNCGAMAATADGRLMVASLTVGDITWSEDDGQTWQKEERYWEDANLDPGGYSYYYMLNMAATSDGTIFGAGSQITEPPVFFSPSRHVDGEWTNFAANIVDDSIIGEVFSMATPDDGMTWLVGGRDQGASSQASGFIYRSTDGGETWASMALPEGTDIVHDIAVDGELGVAVGHRYPTTQGGFILITKDGGQTWTEVESDAPILQSAAISDGLWWAAGDAWLGRGRF